MDKSLQTVNFLKQTHAVTHGFANTIVSLSKDKIECSENLVINQHKGKEELMQIYEKILAVVKPFGAMCTHRV